MIYHYWPMLHGSWLYTPVCFDKFLLFITSVAVCCSKVQNQSWCITQKKTAKRILFAFFLRSMCAGVWCCVAKREPTRPVAEDQHGNAIAIHCFLINILHIYLSTLFSYTLIDNMCSNLLPAIPQIYFVLRYCTPRVLALCVFPLFFSDKLVSPITWSDASTDIQTSKSLECN